MLQYQDDVQNWVHRIKVLLRIYLCIDNRLHIQSSLDLVHFLVTQKMCTKPGEFTKLSVLVWKTKRKVCITKLQAIILRKI